MADKKVIVKVKLNQFRETKGTFMFATSDPDSHVPNLYIRKKAFGDKKAPMAIILTVEEA